MTRNKLRNIGRCLYLNREYSSSQFKFMTIEADVVIN